MFCYFSADCIRFQSNGFDSWSKYLITFKIYRFRGFKYNLQSHLVYDEWVFSYCDINICVFTWYSSHIERKWWYSNKGNVVIDFYCKECTFFLGIEVNNVGVHKIINLRDSDYSYQDQSNDYVSIIIFAKYALPNYLPSCPMSMMKQVDHLERKLVRYWGHFTDGRTIMTSL